MRPTMSKTGKAAVSLSVVLSSVVMATAAMAQPGAQAPGGPAEGSTVIVMQPAPMPPQGAYGAQPPPGAPVVVAVAPQNESWNNVSHINGTPIPVGSRNEYLFERRKAVIAVNPVGWLMGFYSGSLSYALSDNIALRGDLSVFQEIDGDGDDGFVEVGVSAPLYLRRTYEGLFLEPGIISRSWDDGDQTRGPQVLVGWQGMYDSGWTIAAAMGLGRDFQNDSDNDEYGDDTELFFNGYFRVGYGF